MVKIHYQIKCRLCGKYFGAVTATHLYYKHGRDYEHAVWDYEEEFGVPVASSRDVRRRLQKRKLKFWRRRGRQWTPKTIIRHVRQRVRSGKGVAISRVPKKLLEAVQRHFGNWPAAVAAAGFDYVALTEHRRWNRKNIIAEIRRLAARGQRLSPLALVDSGHNDLYLAAKRVFTGGWAVALEAAGFDPAQHMQMPNPWSQKTAAAWVREHRTTPAALRASAAPRDLLHFVRSHLQTSWTAFIESCGIAYPGHKGRSDWSKPKVVAEIQRCHAAGQAMNFSEINRRCSSLVQASKNLFGSWDRACVAAGLDPNAYRRRRRTWDRERADEWMRAQIGAGRSTMAEAAPSGLRTFVNSQLNLRWDEFVKSYGIEYSGTGNRIGFWTRDRVLDEIRRWADAGRATNAKVVSQEFGALYQQAKKFFDGWDAARAAAGVEIVRLPYGPRPKQA